jgi:hypothetical protein
VSGPCVYCGANGSCKCTYRHMRKGASGIEVYNTHSITYGDMKKTVGELLDTYPADTPCVFRFSITRLNP